MRDRQQGHGTVTALSIRKMADALGVSKSQVARDAAAGMPMTSPEAARAWRIATLDVSRTKEGRIDREPPAGSQAPAPSAEPEEPDENSAIYRLHRAENERLKSERAQIELDQLRGSLIDRELANRLAFTAYRSLRDAVLNVPARVKDECAAQADAFQVEQLLERELTAALASFDPTKVLREVEDDESG